jgi:hypothetical protein
MHNVEGKIVSEIVEEKTNEELREALHGYQAKPFAWWRVGLSVLVLMAVGVMVIGVVSSREVVSQALNMYVTPIEMMTEEIPEDNTAQVMFESEPTNKGYFMQYALDVWGDEDVSIEGLLKIADEIEPENSLYHYMAAGVNYRDVIEKQDSGDDSKLSEAERFERVTKYKIIN